MSTARRPGRPRSPEADQAIITATLDLLAEVGYRALGVEQVRARAGVGKATIYRRWPNKEHLVRAAIAHLHHDLPVPEDTGSLSGDLEAAAEAGASVAEATGAALVLPRLLADAAEDEELRRLFVDTLVAPRRERLRVLLERGVERGEIRPDADLELVIDLLVGSVVYRGLISGMDIPSLQHRFLAGLQLLLDGLRPRGGG